jgi:hypothetical protein
MELTHNDCQTSGSGGEHFGEANPRKEWKRFWRNEPEITNANQHSVMRSFSARHCRD